MSGRLAAGLATAIIASVATLYPMIGSCETAEDFLAGCRLVGNASAERIDQDTSRAELPKSPQAQRCWGAITATWDFAFLTYSGGERMLPVCLPENVSRPQLAAVFVNYVDTHPAERSDDFGLVLLKALSAAFPCPHAR